MRTGIAYWGGILGSALGLSCVEDTRYPDIASATVDIRLCPTAGDCAALGASESDAGVDPCLPEPGSELRIGDARVAIVRVEQEVPGSQERTLRVRADGSLRFGTMAEPKTEATAVIALPPPSEYRFDVVAFSAGAGSVRVVAPLGATEKSQVRMVGASVSGFSAPRFIGLRGTLSAFSVPICTTAPSGTELALRSFRGAFDTDKPIVESELSTACPSGYPRSASVVWASRDATFDAEVASPGSRRSCQRTVTGIVTDVAVDVDDSSWIAIDDDTSHRAIPVTLTALGAGTNSVPMRGVAVAVSGLGRNVTTDVVPVTDSNGRTVISITVPSERKQIDLSLLIDQSFRKSVTLAGPDLADRDAGVDSGGEP